MHLAADPLPDPALHDWAPIADFVDAMSTLASGVVLVTCRVGGRPWGMTVTAFTSVSADPPTVLVALDGNGRSAGAIARTLRFGVSILTTEQLEIARLGALSGADKFLDGLIRLGGEAPAVLGALAHLDCDVSRMVEAGDHTVFFGRVRTAERLSGGEPLLYHRRSYRSVR
jgi:flavin reductase (DIM6/NTAB) family NADH-FMN oxidoreductase RutF